MKKILWTTYLALAINTFSYDTITELYIKNYFADNVRTLSPEAKLVIDESEYDNFELNLELAINDEESKVDVAKMKFYYDDSDLEIGRNRIGWGVGTNFNPSDIFNAKSLSSAFDPFYRKEGRDSLIYTKYFSNSNMQIVYSFPTNKTINSLDDKRDSDIGLKFKKNLLDFDSELIYISKGKHERFIGVEEEKDSLYGINLKGDIPATNFGIWNEMIYSTEYEEIGSAFGVDTYFGEKYYFNLEYFRNYTGEQNKADYNFALSSVQENLAKNYLIPAFQIDFNEKLNTYTYLMINLDDSSFILGDTLNYYYNDIVSINFGIYYQAGDDDTEYGYYRDEYGTLNAGGTIKAIF